MLTEIYHIQASAPFSCSRTESGYELKCSMITTVSLGFAAASGRARRESAIREVMEGVSRH